MRSRSTKALPSNAWGLDVQSHKLSLHGHSLSSLAATFGTPLHLINEPRLIDSARQFQSAVASAYRGNTSVHFPLKCNAVPGVLQLLRAGGMRAEVMTEHELDVALLAGFEPHEIIVNGPYKPETLLLKCVMLGVRLIVLDSLEELTALSEIARRTGRRVEILLRVDPGNAARDGNWLSGVASRRVTALLKRQSVSSFGFSLANGEARMAMQLLSVSTTLRFCGFHFHIGTGIHDMESFRIALRCLPRLRALAREYRMAFDYLDVGGGLASRTTREFSSIELLTYQALGTLPAFDRGAETAASTQDSLYRLYAATIAEEVHRAFAGAVLPNLLFEPGRSIVSSNGILLLTVVGRKRRSDEEQWAVCDGGLSTVSMPTYYEYHEVFTCEALGRKRDLSMTLLGPGCFAGDVIYRNKRMPDLAIGETLAIMDAGAYFTSLESAFGYPRPMTIAVNDTNVRVLRERETLEQMTQRDRLPRTDRCDYQSPPLTQTSSQLTEPCAST